jgi:hypothetical protein
VLEYLSSETERLASAHARRDVEKPAYLASDGVDPQHYYQWKRAAEENSWQE